MESQKQTPIQRKNLILAFQEGFQLGRCLDDYKSAEDAYRDSMTREITGDKQSMFTPHWAKFFENMQANCGFPLYNAFRLQWYNYFFNEYGENVNLGILEMIVQGEKCFASPKRAMKYYKKYFKVSIFQKLKRAIELISVAKATRNL